MARVVAVLFIVTIGCALPASTPPRGVASTDKGYTLEIRSASGSGTVRGREFMINRDNVSLELKNSILTVNGQKVGIIAEGSTIAVDEDGKVLVNGSEPKSSN
jgi:hypothetical protein